MNRGKGKGDPAWQAMREPLLAGPGAATEETGDFAFEKIPSKPPMAREAEVRGVVGL